MFRSRSRSQRRVAVAVFHPDLPDAVPGTASSTGGARLDAWLASWAPLLALAIFASVLGALGADLWLADRIHAWEGGRWTLKQAFLTERIIHLVGRDLSALAWIAVLALWGLSWQRARLRAWRRPLGYLLLSTLLATLLVSWVKSWSNIDCPWDLFRYGGQRPYTGLLSVRPAGLPRAACFPAGHASGGYAWMALYFCFLHARPAWRWRGLALGIGAGLLFGFSQQLRGAHFLSHDAWTATICWGMAFVLQRVCWPPALPTGSGRDARVGGARDA